MCAQNFVSSRWLLRAQVIAFAKTRQIEFWDTILRTFTHSFLFLSHHLSFSSLLRRAHHFIFIGPCASFSFSLTIIEGEGPFFRFTLVSNLGRTWLFSPLVQVPKWIKGGKRHDDDQRCWESVMNDIPVKRRKRDFTMESKELINDEMKHVTFFDNLKRNQT